MSGSIDDDLPLLLHAYWRELDRHLAFVGGKGPPAGRQLEIGVTATSLRHPKIIGMLLSRVSDFSRWSERLMVPQSRYEMVLQSKRFDGSPPPAFASNG